MRYYRWQRVSSGITLMCALALFAPASPVWCQTKAKSQTPDSTASQAGQSARSKVEAAKTAGKVKAAVSKTPKSGESTASPAASEDYGSLQAKKPGPERSEQSPKTEVPPRTKSEVPKLPSQTPAQPPSRDDPRTNVSMGKVPDVIGSTCVEARGILGNNHFGCTCEPQNVTHQKATRTEPPVGQDARLGSVVTVYFDANPPSTTTVEVPLVQGLTAQAARDKLLQAGLVMGEPTNADPGSGEPGTVSEQDPKPPTRVAPGSVVKVTIVPGQFKLSGPSETYVANVVKLQVTLFPAKEAAVYTFNWRDGPGVITDVKDSFASHQYQTPGHYQVSASVADPDGGGRLESNVVELDVKAYTLSLVFDPVRPRIGDQVTLRAELNPTPQGAVEYRFSIPGGGEESSREPTIRRVFSAAGTYDVSVNAVLGGISLGSGRARLDVPSPDGGPTPPPWVWWVVAGAVGGTATTITRNSIRRTRINRVYQNTSVTPNPGLWKQTFDQPELVRSDNVVLVRVNLGQLWDPQGPEEENPR